MCVLLLSSSQHNCYSLHGIVFLSHAFRCLYNACIMSTLFSQTIYLLVEKELEVTKPTHLVRLLSVTMTMIFFFMTFISSCNDIQPFAHSGSPMFGSKQREGSEYAPPACCCLANTGVSNNALMCLRRPCTLQSLLLHYEVPTLSPLESKMAPYS